VSDEPWAFWDFLPTAVEVAGAKAPAALKTDGLSLVSFLQGGSAPKRDYFYWELHEGQSLQAARWGDWKAVRNGPQAKVEVYDLKTDSAERHDLAATRPCRRSQLANARPESGERGQESQEGEVRENRRFQRMAVGGWEDQRAKGEARVGHDLSCPPVRRARRSHAPTLGRPAAAIHPVSGFP
jgi:arylsulfatase A-like enzyme